VPGSRARVLKGHRAAITALEFSASGDMLVSGGADATVRIWSLRDQGPADAATWPELIDYFRRVTHACLTVDQQMRLLDMTEAAARAALQRCEQPQR
jgi:WD40 repeat protein